MVLNPSLANGAYALVFVLAISDSGIVETRASVHHLPDDVLVNEEKIRLDLLIEVVHDLDRALIVGARFGPFPADPTCLTNLGNQV